MIEEVNLWLLDHQLFVTLIITPVLAALVGGLAAWYSGKRAILSARSERMHQSALEIARYRQAWIDALRDDLAEFTGISAIALNVAPPFDRAERVAILSMRIRMRMNRDDPDYQELVESLTRDTESYFLGKNNEERKGVPLVLVSQKILKREWERLKQDLRAVEK